MCSLVSIAGCQGHAFGAENPEDIITDLTSTDLHVRKAAAASLVEAAAMSVSDARKRRKPESHKIIQEHVESLVNIVEDKNEDVEVRSSIVRAIAMSGSPKTVDQKVIPSLIRVMLDEQDHELVRSWIAMVLPDIGEAKRVAPALLAVSHCKNRIVRASASGQLGRLGLEPEVLIAWADQAMNDQSPGVRISAVSTAAELSKQHKEASSILFRGLTDSDQMVQDVAVKLLTFVDAGKSEDIRGALEELLDHKEPAIRMNAAAALMRISENTSKYLESLIAGIESDDAALREAAALALCNVEHHGKPAVPALTKALTDPDLRKQAG